MKDNELYQYLLGLESPWTVKSVALDIQQQKVDVRAEHPQNSSCHALNADASSLLMIILLKGLGDISIVANLKHIFMQAFLG